MNTMNDLYPLPSNTDFLPGEALSAETVSNILTAAAKLPALRSSCEVPEHIMQSIYAHGYHLYQKGCIDDAKTFFEFLCIHDMFNADYLLGMAAIHQQKKDYPKAIQLYFMCFALDNKNYRTMLYAGQCHLHLKNREQARACFAKVDDGEAPDALKKQARAYLSVLPPVNETAKKTGAQHA